MQPKLILNRAYPLENLDRIQSYFRERCNKNNKKNKRRNRNVRVNWKLNI